MKRLLLFTTLQAIYFQSVCSKAFNLPSTTSTSTSQQHKIVKKGGLRGGQITNNVFDHTPGDTAETRIVGGNTAIAIRFPYYTYLFGPSGRCGGSLIAPELVLTAASCTDQTQAHVGRNNLFSTEDFFEEFRIVDEFIHPLYNPQLEKAFDQKIVLLSGNAALQPIEVYNSIDDIQIDSKLTVIGLGVTNEEEGTLPGNLQQADLWSVPLDQCEDPPDTAMCAGGGEGVGVCFGDNGGPLIRLGDDPTRDILVGTIPGQPETCGDRADIFQKITTSYTWIRNVVCSESEKPPISFGCPTDSPTSFPTAMPSLLPSLIPSTSFPSEEPTHSRTQSPTSSPTEIPTAAPSIRPSMIPSGSPTGLPSETLSGPPTTEPSLSPSTLPTFTESQKPTTIPSLVPSDMPTNVTSTLEPSATQTSVKSSSEKTKEANTESLSPNEKKSSAAAWLVPVLLFLVIGIVSVLYAKKRCNMFEGSPEEQNDSESAHSDTIKGSEIRGTADTSERSLDNSESEPSERSVDSASIISEVSTSGSERGDYEGSLRSCSDASDTSGESVSYESESSLSDASEESFSEASDDSMSGGSESSTDGSGSEASVSIFKASERSAAEHSRASSIALL